jgi:hypothetical protein
MSSINLKKIYQEIEKTTEQMLSLKTMLRGSYGKAFRRCGKSNCRCANSDQDMHPFCRISWTEKGKGYTRNIPEQDRKWVEQAVENYKAYRKGRKYLLTLQNELDIQLTEFKKKQIEKTRKKKIYLK